MLVLNLNSMQSIFCSEIVSLMSSAADFVLNIQPKKLLPSSGKLKREVSMEEIIQVIFYYRLQLNGPSIHLFIVLNLSCT